MRSFCWFVGGLVTALAYATVAALMVGAAVVVAMLWCAGKLLQLGKRRYRSSRSRRR